MVVGRRARAFYSTKAVVVRLGFARCVCFRRPVGPLKESGTILDTLDWKVMRHDLLFFFGIKEGPVAASR